MGSDQGRERRPVEGLPGGKLAAQGAGVPRGGVGGGPPALPGHPGVPVPLCPAHRPPAAAGSPLGPSPVLPHPFVDHMPARAPVVQGSPT